MAKTKDENWDYGKEPENYEEWLEATHEKDSKLNKEWYDTPDDKRSDFINKHKSWWNK